MFGGPRAARILALRSICEIFQAKSSSYMLPPQSQISIFWTARLRTLKGTGSRSRQFCGQKNWSKIFNICPIKSIHKKTIFFIANRSGHSRWSARSMITNICSRSNCCSIMHPNRTNVRPATKASNSNLIPFYLAEVIPNSQTLTWLYFNSIQLILWSKVIEKSHPSNAIFCHSRKQEKQNMRELDNHNLI